MSHGSLTDAVHASGHVRCTAWWSDSTPSSRCCIDHGHVACEFVITCSPALAIPPRVVQDAVVTRVAPGEDRRVVRERHRRHARRSRPTRTPCPSRSGGRRSAPRRSRRACRARWGSRRRAGSRRRDAGVAVTGFEHVGAHLAVLTGEILTVGTRRDAEELGDRGRDVDEARRPRDETVVADALARDHERRPRLQHAERPVLTPVAALVLPVVRSRVDDAQVGCRGMVEELGGLLERERIGVVAPGRVRVGELGRRGRRGARATGRRRGRRPRWRRPRSRRSRRGETRPGRRRWPPRTRRRGALEHHVDDRRQLRVEQYARAPASPERRSRRPGYPAAAATRFRGPIARFGAWGLNCPFPAVSRERFGAHLHSKAFRHHTRLARHRRRRPRARPRRHRRSPRCSAASTSRSGRRTSTAATT